jgi:hypothetical protein
VDNHELFEVLVDFFVGGRVPAVELPFGDSLEILFTFCVAFFGCEHGVE